MNNRFKNIECRVLNGEQELIKFLYPVDLDKDIKTQILDRTKVLLKIDNLTDLKIQVSMGFKQLWGNIEDLKL